MPIRHVGFQQGRLGGPHSQRINGRLCPIFGYRWRYPKARVYDYKLRVLENLKETIRVEVTQIDRAMLEKAKISCQEHLQNCINKNGPHVKDIFFQNRNFSNANLMGTQLCQ